jgi:uncharacterized protein YecT (DUF1311 family)
MVCSAMMRPRQRWLQYAKSAVSVPSYAAVTDETQRRIQELSALLERIRDLCRSLQEEPGSEQFIARLCEFSCLLDKAEARLRELER